MKKILFVEDNEMLLQLYAMMLSADHRWEVATAPDGLAAMELQHIDR